MTGLVYATWKPRRSMLRCEPLPGFVLTTAAARQRRLLQTLGNERTLHPTPAILGQRCSTEERRNASFRNDPAAAAAHHLVFDARQEGQGSR